MHKALEDTGIKLDCVASDILGRSGRAMLDALVNGTRDPEVLAELARGRLRSKIPALKEALEGRFDHLHAVWIGAILEHIDFLDRQIASLTEAIGEQIAPFEQAVELLCTIPGVQRRTAEVIIAEIGIDMSVFPTDKQLASWAGICPGNDQSAGKRRSGKTRKGSKWLDWRRRSRDRRDPHQRRLPRRPIRPPQTPPRAQESARRRQALDPDRLLAHARHRRALQRPRGDYYRKRDPNASPNDSSPNSKRSDTTSPSRPRLPERYFPVRPAPEAPEPADRRGIHRRS